jgi:DNA polymerase-3 subunit delta'
MKYPVFFYPKNSLQLFGLKKEFKFLTTLYKNKRLPKTLMLSGTNGNGKSTLLNHFFFSIFDEKNYDVQTNYINDNSVFYKQFNNDIFSNIIFIKGSDFNSVKIEDIRQLKIKISQSSILNKDRFIVLDDVELFNTNCLNALLKTIEEPKNNTFFFLINNNSKPLLETIKSRTFDFQIRLNENERILIIKNLINFYNLETFLDPVNSKLSPGNFLKFDYICREENISTTNHLVENLSSLFNLYKKHKDILYMNIAFFVTEIYFKYLLKDRIFDNKKIFEIKDFIFNNLNNFIIYNISQNAVLNEINNKLKNE